MENLRRQTASKNSSVQITGRCCSHGEERKVQSLFEDGEEHNGNCPSLVWVSAERPSEGKHFPIVFAAMDGRTDGPPSFIFRREGGRMHVLLHEIL
jgi:hypothetical protein